MGVLVSPIQSDLFKVLGRFLLDILPTGTEVFQSQVNRVPTPKSSNWVMMTPTRRSRFETNTDRTKDVSFLGSVANGVLTVTEVLIGQIVVPATLFGPTVLPGTLITAQLTAGGVPIGSFAISQDPVGDLGGPGNYQLSIPQNINPGKLASGAKQIYTPTEVAIQLDVYGPASVENAQIVSQIFRDEYAYDFFRNLSDTITPLVADDPRQMPWINDQAQYENRWTVEATFQLNETLSIPQQYADSVILGVINVDAEYPPS